MAKPQVEGFICIRVYVHSILLSHRFGGYPNTVLAFFLRCNCPYPYHSGKPMNQASQSYYLVIMIGSGMGSVTEQSQSETVSPFWLALLRKRHLILEWRKNLTPCGLWSPCEVSLTKNEFEATSVVLQEEKRAHVWDMYFLAFTLGLKHQGVRGRYFQGDQNSKTAYGLCPASQQEVCPIQTTTIKKKNSMFCLSRVG